MRKAFLYIFFMTVLCFASAAETVRMKGAFITPLQERDSVLIADQIKYGFELKKVEEGTVFALPQWQEDTTGTLILVHPWELDTLKVFKGKKGRPSFMDISGSIVLAPFEEGKYILPEISVLRKTPEGKIDTLVFESMELEVKTMPVDTASFVPHDLKAQMTYPVTFKEVMPWAGGGLVLIGLIYLVIWLIRRYVRRNSPENVHKEPAHIVALRKLDLYRGTKMWVPEKQKAFYSGITDALREYLDARYGIGAMEMTTRELFDCIKKTDVPEQLREDLKVLFERADFVKFAKYVASEEENASSLPLAVRFVTQTYQEEIEEEKKAGHETDTGGTV